MALFRVDFSGRGELADRQQKLAQMLSRLQKISEGEEAREVKSLDLHYSVTHPVLPRWCVFVHHRVQCSYNDHQPNDSRPWW